MRERFLIAQVSDIHCGHPRYDPDLTEACLGLLAEAQPDLVLVPGDLTDMGYPEEFEQAAEVLDRLPRPWFVVPGNHDERNVGWKTFMRRFGPRWQRHDVDFGVPRSDVKCPTLRLVGCDSAEPDLDDGELGRVRHGWVAEGLEGGEDIFRVVMLHHHLVPVPNTGREVNVTRDAGDVLETLAASRVDLVLSGHKHVPYVWWVNGLAVVTSGTATSWRTRGEVPPSFNLIEITPETITVNMVETATGAATPVSLPRADTAGDPLQGRALAPVLAE